MFILSTDKITNRDRVHAAEGLYRLDEIPELVIIWRAVQIQIEAK